MAGIWQLNQAGTMTTPNDHLESLFQQALVYQARGDVYSAVKLYRRIIRVMPDWFSPYQQLAAIYKQRQEWKPLLHYAKKAVALEAATPELWWDLGLAAYALGKRRLAQAIFGKFGSSRQLLPAVSVQIELTGLVELLWVQPISPVAGQVLSIPQPASGYGYRDVVLFDRQILGHQVANRRRYPIYGGCGLLKRAFYQTFSATVPAAGADAIQVLEQLCLKASIGFEVWSNAVKALAAPGKSEFHTPLLGTPEPALWWLAFATRERAELEALLSNWKIITLLEISGLEAHPLPPQ